MSTDLRHKHDPSYLTVYYHHLFFEKIFIQVLRVISLGEKP